MSEADTLFYLDTSALLPYYRREAASGLVQQFLSAQTQAIRISILTEVELASALARTVRTGELDEVDASGIGSLFEDDTRAGLFERVSMTASHYRQAKKWLLLRSTALRTLDALHLACCHAMRAEMVTADRILHGSAIQLKVPCRLLG
jgi:predicted nucleic acid-binding protein